MKRCSYCGAEYPDELNECPVDHASVTSSGPSAPDADKQKQITQNGKRVGFRILGIVLIVLAIGAYIGGVHDFENGDIDFRVGRTARGVTVVSNLAYRIALVLTVAGVMCFGYSFQTGQDKKRK
jgi:hypothetical protein